MALRGVNVLEFAGLAPAPFCGMVLSDFGASVLRVDKIGGNVNMDVLCHSKKSIAIDLKQQKGIDIIKKLCKQTDVLLEPFRQGVMEKLGLGPDILLKENPKLIYARLTGYGQTGKYSRKAGHDINYVALSGLLSLFGRKDQKPTFPVNLAADFGGGGLMCTLGIILALLERSKSGLGQVVDCNMVHGTAYLGSWLYRSQILPMWANKRGCNIIDSGAHFYDVYQTKDGKFLSVGALEPQFYDHLLKGLEMSHEEAPQFEMTDEIKKLFTEKFLSKTLNEWMAIFDDLDACVVPVLELHEAPIEQHNVDQRTFVQIDNNLYAPRPAPNLSRTPGQNFAKKFPQRGEHTKPILQSLSYTEEEIAVLEENGVIEIYSKNKL